MAQAQYAGTGRRKNADLHACVWLILVKSQLTKRCRRISPTQDLRLVINNLCGTSTGGVHTTYTLTLQVVDTLVNQVRSVTGIARALLQVRSRFPQRFIETLDFNTRDARMVERKKPGVSS